MVEEENQVNFPVQKGLIVVPEKKHLFILICHVCYAVMSPAGP